MFKKFMRARPPMASPPSASVHADGIAPSLGQHQAAQLGITQFSYFAGYVVLRGWLHREGSRIRSMSFQIGDSYVFEFSEVALASPGAPSADCGFAASFDTGIDAYAFSEPSLHVVFDDGHQERFQQLGVPEILQDRGHRLFPEFIERVRSMPQGRMLEIGSRARSGISRRDVAPSGWQYVGVDIMQGPNVDVVGDAHELSKLLPHDSFDAAMSLSVFEHLAMPWKVALELNRVLKLGAFAFIQTHQTFPLHDEPWDFWRVSKDAWPALFNAKTGFRVVEAAMAEPMMFVAKRWHPGVSLHESHGCAVSSVLVEKTGESLLSWDVDLSDVLANKYPE
jgi:Methyltransferase domain